MKPTTRLRFVKREEFFQVSERDCLSKTVHILQQWWKHDLGGEWRDVEMEKNP